MRRVATHAGEMHHLHADCAVVMQAAGEATTTTVERLERDEGGLTDEQRLAAVMADAPELAVLLSDLQHTLAEVRSHVGPVLKEVLLPCSIVLRLHDDDKPR